MDNNLVEWLLESTSPSIRYLTLRDLLDRPQDDPDVQMAQQTIMQTGSVPMILAGQTEQGHWQGERGYYTPKYVSSHWSMVLLMEYAADPADPRIQRGADAMLGATEQRALKSHEEQDWGCFWGNVLRYVVYAGRGDDPRLPNIVKTLLLASQSRGWGCRMNNDLACAWGAIRALWGLAALPTRTPEIEAAIQSGIEFVFGQAFTLRQGDYPTQGTVHKHWSRLNFPLYYQVDILFALRVAAELKLWDRPRVQDAVQWLTEQRQPNGRWRGISPYRTQSYRHLGNSSDINRWVSYHAAYVLKQAGYISS